MQYAGLFISTTSILPHYFQWEKPHVRRDRGDVADGISWLARKSNQLHLKSGTRPAFHTAHGVRASVDT